MVTNMQFFGITYVLYRIFFILSSSQCVTFRNEIFLRIFELGEILTVPWSLILQKSIVQTQEPIILKKAHDLEIGNWNYHVKSFQNILNRYGLMIDPCRVPFWILNEELSEPLTRTIADIDLYHVYRNRHSAIGSISISL